MRLKRLIPAILAAVVTVAVVAGVIQMTRRPPIVDVTAAAREDVVRVLAVTGRVRPRLSTRVIPLVSGTILSLAKREGDAVRRGDVLATLDARITEASIQQATAQLAARRVDTDQRRREFERLNALNAAGGVADREVDQARSALELAEVSVRQFEALIEEARGRLGDFTLRSPIDGYVLSRPVDPGQNVTSQSVLYELATGSDAEVEVEIDEQYLGELRLGLPAAVSPLTGERTVYRATIALIGRQVSEASGAVPVRLAFDGASPRMPVGLSVDVNLEIARHPGAVTVSRAAVAGLGDEPYVLLVRNDSTERRDVEVIDWPSPRIVVTKGVVPGDVIVATPRGTPAGVKVRTRLASDAL